MDLAPRESSPSSRRAPDVDDDPDVYGRHAGRPGLIGPGSVSWEVNADLASVSQAGAARDRARDPASVRRRRRAGPVQLP